MSAIPSLSSSALQALQNGFSTLNRGAAEIASTDSDSPSPATDSVDVRSVSITDTEPMLAGVRDLMLAHLQVKSGATLLHAYDDERQTLFDMLRPDSSSAS